MFCVECGKDTKIFRDGVCADCYLKTHRFTSGPSIITIPYCSHCQSFKFKNSWYHISFGDIIKKWINHCFTISKELARISINPSCEDVETHTIIQCNVRITGYVSQFQISEDHVFTVRLKKTVCDICSKQFGGYYEAIIQIRADKRSLTKEEIQNIKDEIETSVELLRTKGNRGLYITDFGEEHGGIDFYLSEKGIAHSIVKMLQKKYAGEIKISSKNVGMKDSKQVYRMTYTLRLPFLKINDFICYNGSYYYVRSISANKLRVIELSSLQEQMIDLRDMQKIRVIGGKELINKMILISETSEELQLMHPKTYETIEITKPKNVFVKDKIVKIVKIDENYFIINL